MEQNVILVTGFGPFREHKINASWEAVKLLREDEFDGYKIIKSEVPVTYEYIEGNIPQLWNRHKPHLVIHVGVSKYAKEITIETQAFRSGYKQLDCEGCCHATGDVCDSKSGDDCILAGIDVDKLCKRLDNKDLLFTKSTNAGRYLCEYIYYKSLNIDSRRTLFVHVPVLEQPYTAEQLARGLLLIISGALEQLAGSTQN